MTLIQVIAALICVSFSFLGIPKLVEGDATRIRQVLINLLTNAMKASSRGEVILNVLLEEESREFCNVLFSVIDRGVGIKEIDKCYVFQEFAQIDSPFTKHHVSFQ